MLTRILCILQHIKQRPKGAFIKLNFGLFYFCGILKNALFILAGICGANPPGLVSPYSPAPRQPGTVELGRAWGGMHQPEQPPAPVNRQPRGNSFQPPGPSTMHRHWVNQCQLWRESLDFFKSTVCGRKEYKYRNKQQRTQQNKYLVAFVAAKDTHRN